MELKADKRTPSVDLMPWLVSGSSVFILGLLFFAHLGSALRVAVPACAVLVGVTLYVKKQAAYLQFTLWLWFLTPLLRRLIDYRFGYADQNLVLLTPLLVTGIAGIALGEWQKLRREMTPFLLCIGGVLYGFVIGILRHASNEVLYGLFNWMVPVLFGLSIYSQWPLYRQHRRVIERTFLLGVLVMGIYGIYQYCAPPAWDVYWWESLPYGTAASFGRPVEFQVRVWSTLNAPAPFADVMGIGLLLTLVAKSKFKLLCGIAGLGAFVLSLSRTEWLGCIIGIIFIVYRGSRAFAFKTLLSFLALCALCVPLMSIGPTQRIISQRFQTLGHLGQDESVQERSKMYARLSGDVLLEPFGQGVSNAATYDGYALDSGPLRFLLNLGILGTVLYFMGVLQIALKLLPKQIGDDPMQVASGAILLAVLAKFISLSAFESVAGTMVWLCIGLGLAAQRYYTSPAEASAVEEHYSYAS